MLSNKLTMQDIKKNFSYYFSIKRIKKWVVAYFILIVVVLGFSIWTHRQDTQVVIVTGKVVGVEQRLNKHGEPEYAEVISYDLDEKTHQFVNPRFLTWEPETGEVRTLVVNPLYPPNTHIKTPFEVHGFIFDQLPKILLFWLIGSVIFGIGWLSFANYYEFFRQAIKVSGNVSSYKLNPNTAIYDEEISYYIDGKLYKTNNTFCSSGKPCIGAIREVAIDPNDFTKVLVHMPIWPFLLVAFAGVAVWGYFLFLKEF